MTVNVEWTNDGHRVLIEGGMTSLEHPNDCPTEPDPMSDSAHLFSAYCCQPGRDALSIGVNRNNFAGDDEWWQEFVDSEDHDGEEFTIEWQIEEDVEMEMGYVVARYDVFVWRFALCSETQRAA